MPRQENEIVRVRMHETLRRALPEAEGDRLAYNLADLHAAFLNASNRIAELSQWSFDSPAAETRRVLSGLAGELYQHILPHLDATRADLLPWISRLYDEAEARGEL
jgi:hypothetical protein